MLRGLNTKNKAMFLFWGHDKRFKHQIGSKFGIFQ